MCIQHCDCLRTPPSPGLFSLGWTGNRFFIPFLLQCSVNTDLQVLSASPAPFGDRVRGPKIICISTSRVLYSKFSLVCSEKDRATQTASFWPFLAWFPSAGGHPGMPTLQKCISGPYLGSEVNHYNCTVSAWNECLHIKKMLNEIGHLTAILLCMTLHWNARHCTAFHCTALHCTALHCTALCAALYCTALHYLK